MYRVKSNISMLAKSVSNKKFYLYSIKKKWNSLRVQFRPLLIVTNHQYVRQQLGKATLPWSVSLTVFRNQIRNQNSTPFSQFCVVLFQNTQEINWHYGVCVVKRLWLQLKKIKFATLKCLSPKNYLKLEATAVYKAKTILTPYTNLFSYIIKKKKWIETSVAGADG